VDNYITLFNLEKKKIKDLDVNKDLILTYNLEKEKFECLKIIECKKFHYNLNEFHLNLYEKKNLFSVFFGNFKILSDRGI